VPSRRWGVGWDVGREVRHGAWGMGHEVSDVTRERWKESGSVVGVVDKRVVIDLARAEWTIGSPVR
jgi:hypothetical protein